MKLLNNMHLTCPFWKNKIKFTKSITDYKTSYKSLSGVYAVSSNVLPKGFDLACIVSTVPTEKEIEKRMFPHTLMKKLCDHFNVIILKTKCHHLCFTFSSVLCKSGLHMKSSLLENKRMSNQIDKWKVLQKQKKVSKALCYSLGEIPRLTLHKYLQRSTFEQNEWKSILFQLCFTMNLLQKEIPGFVHHNLSPKHVYLKKVPHGGQFIYKIGNTKYYVPNCGYIVKIIPSSYSYSDNLYDNELVYNEDNQKFMGLHAHNTSFYDFHYFFNVLFYCPNVPSFVKSSIKKWIQHISNVNTPHVVNMRLRDSREVKNKYDFRILLHSNFFNNFKKVQKNKIIFYPQNTL